MESINTPLSVKDSIISSTVRLSRGGRRVGAFVFLFFDCSISQWDAPSVDTPFFSIEKKVKDLFSFRRPPCPVAPRSPWIDLILIQLTFSDLCVCVCLSVCLAVCWMLVPLHSPFVRRSLCSSSHSVVDVDGTFARSSAPVSLLSSSPPRGPPDRDLFKRDAKVDAPSSFSSCSIFPLCRPISASDQQSSLHYTHT